MDTRCCKYCGVEFSHLVDNDGTFDEGYCCKFHRKDHERQLIREGKMEPIEGTGVVLKNQQYRDLSGETVWFPKDEKPYFDQGLRRVFHSAKEKAEFLREKKYISTGESDFTKSKHKDLVHYTREQARKHTEGEKNGRT